MKHKKTRLCTLLLLSLGLTGLQAQNALQVKEKTGTQTSFILSGIRKLTFPSGNLMVSKTDGTTQMFSLSNIRLLSFGGAIINVNQPILQEEGNLLLYPNPVVDELTLTFKTTCMGSFQIDIINMQGKVVFTKTANQTEGNNQLNINLSNIPKGLYVCRMINGLTIETSKFIKTK